MVSNTAPNDMTRPADYRAYFVQAVLAGACFIAVIVAFNLVIDPFGIFRLVTLPGINNDKSPALLSGHRNIRDIEIARDRPQVVVFGSSREQYGMTPDTVSSMTGLPANNAAIAALSAFDIAPMVANAAKMTNLKLAIIGLDYFSFDDKRGPASFTAGSRLDIAVGIVKRLGRVLLPLQAIEESFQTIAASRCRPGQVEFGAHGSRNIDAAFNRCDGAPPLPTPQILAGIKDLVNFDSDRAALAALQTAMQQCATLRLDCRFVIGPMHAAYLTGLHMVAFPAYLQWKRDVTQMARENGVTLFDFSTTHPASQLPFARTRGHFYDTLHYDPVIGGDLLRTILHTGQGTPARTDLSGAAELALIARFTDANRAFVDELRTRLGAAP